MRSKSTSFLVYFVFAIILLSTFAISDFSDIQIPKQRYYNFILQVPDTEVSPGDNVTIVGKITNMGTWTLRQVNFTLQDMPYSYQINPVLFQEVRILRDWNPDVGVFRLPYNFSITIFVPQNATGVHLIKLIGQETGSWRQVSNSTEFILQVLSTSKVPPVSAPSVAKVSVSEISVPSVINQSNLFTASLFVSNGGDSPAAVNVTMTVPSDWNISESVKQVTVSGNSTEKVNFDITPSNMAGTITAKLSYESDGNVSTITKSSLLITPASSGQQQVPDEEPGQGLLTRLITLVKSLSPIVIGILILISLIVIWNLYKITTVLSKRGKKPEESKKATASI